MMYIKPMRLIENMANGDYFMDNPSDIHKIIDKHGEWVKDGNVNELKLPSLSNETRQIFYYMISHQLAKNGYVNESIGIKLYPKLFGSIPYIEQMLNNICNKRTILCINMRAMSTTILKHCSDNIHGGFGGYIGYSLCSKVFLCHNYHGINFHTFHALFPNVKRIFAFELMTISDEFLNDILSFLTKNKKSDIEFIELHLVSQNENTMDLSSKVNPYQKEFESIGFIGSAVEKDELYGTQCIVIKRG